MGGGGDMCDKVDCARAMIGPLVTLQLPSYFPPLLQVIHHSPSTFLSFIDRQDVLSGLEKKNPKPPLPLQ